MKNVVFTSMLFLLLWMKFSQIKSALFPSPDLTLISRLIRKNGYPIELHKNIQTSDGYLLDMQRIPYGKHNKNATLKRTPILLMHGLMSSAEHWIITGPHKGLGYILADSGYDVWLGNARGSSHSRKHVSLNPDYDSNYWQFSWHEIGIYDTPTMIDYILEVTNNKEMMYIGHSQGCTSFFVMASMLPKYNAKIKLMIALAPAVFMSHIRHPVLGPLGILGRFGTGTDWLPNMLGLNELSPSNDVMQMIGSTACQETAVLRDLCTNLLFLLAGYDSRQFNRTVLPDIIGLNTGGASVKQVLHYAQGANSGHFRQYDFGTLINLSKYRQLEPPDYSLSKVTCPVALYYSNNDWLVSERDIHILNEHLPHVIDKYMVNYDGFNHLDFLWANDIMHLLYKRVLLLLEKYNK